MLALLRHKLYPACRLLVPFGEGQQFAPAVQNECTQLSSMKGFQSYVELLTCLQMTQDAKKLPTQQ